MIATLDDKFLFFGDYNHLFASLGIEFDEHTDTAHISKSEIFEIIRISREWQRYESAKVYAQNQYEPPSSIIQAIKFKDVP